MEDKIRQLANQYRNAIDSALAYEKENFDLAFQSFPTGCCTMASDLLAEYLMEHGIFAKSIRGHGPGGNNHEWLIINNEIHVDITGDQYKTQKRMLNYDISVYVGREDDFHQLFKPFTIESVSLPQPDSSGVCNGVYVKHCGRKELIKKYL